MSDSTYFVFYRYTTNENWYVVDIPMSYEAAITKVTVLTNKEGIRNVEMVPYQDIARYFGIAYTVREIAPSRLHA